MEVPGWKSSVDVPKAQILARHLRISAMAILSPIEIDSTKYVQVLIHSFSRQSNFLPSLQICEPVKSLKKCKYFRDVTWTYITYPDNSTQQIMHCRCPKNSVAYLIRRHAYQTVTGTGYQYSFACSPQTVIFKRYLIYQKTYQYKLPNVKKKP